MYILFSRVTYHPGLSKIIPGFSTENGASLVIQMAKNLPAVQETQVWIWVWKIPSRRKWLLTPVSPGEFHGQRSLVGYSPQDGKESDTTEWLTLSLSSISTKKPTGILTCLCAKSLQSCPTLCDPIDCSPPGSSVHGILQARILEWVAISFSMILIGIVFNLYINLGIIAVLTILSLQINEHGIFFSCLDIV